MRPYGAKAIIITWPEEIEEAILFDILRFTKFLASLEDFSSGWEFISAYNSLTLVNNNEQVDSRTLVRKLQSLYEGMDDTESFERTLWKLPVCYDREFGIDLEETANNLGLSEDKIVELHTGSVYTIYGIGFLPGFMYLGGLHESLESARRANPRLKVLKGSVGIAGKQTGIYPQDSPGGWNIIGNCPIPLFNSRRETPCIVSVGDKIQFFKVSRAEYEVHKIEAEVDIYSIEKKRIDD